VNISQTYHPDLELLKNFSQGLLSTGLSVGISAHLELCSVCREKSEQLEAELADHWVNASDERSDPDMDAIFSQIVAQPQVTRTIQPSKSLKEVHMLDHSVSLPRVLAKSAQQGLVWKKLPGGINQARVVLDNETQCDFIYMKPGGQIPPHRHQGTEVTLVLDGHFHDDMGSYGPADFLMRDANHTHSPISENGCLCFAVLDSPLKFTSGFARLLNPINQLLFNRA